MVGAFGVLPPSKLFRSSAFDVLFDLGRWRPSWSCCIRPCGGPCIWYDGADWTHSHYREGLVGIQWNDLRLGQGRGGVLTRLLIACTVTISQVLLLPFKVVFWTQLLPILRIMFWWKPTGCLWMGCCVGSHMVLLTAVYKTLSNTLFRHGRKKKVMTFVWIDSMLLELSSEWCSLRTGAAWCRLLHSNAYILE